MKSSAWNLKTEDLGTLVREHFRDHFSQVKHLIIGQKPKKKKIQITWHPSNGHEISNFCLAHCHMSN